MSTPSSPSSSIDVSLIYTNNVLDTYETIEYYEKYSEQTSINVVVSDDYNKTEQSYLYRYHHLAHYVRSNHINMKWANWFDVRTRLQQMVNELHEDTAFNKVRKNFELISFIYNSIVRIDKTLFQA